MDVKQYYRAKTIADAYTTWLNHPQNAIMGGGLWLKKLNSPVETLIDLGALGYNIIEENNEFITIGSLVTLRTLEEHPSIKAIGNGFLSKAWGSVMGVALRQQATIGGSIAGKFPFSDVITPLLTLDVTLSLYPHREIALVDFLQEKGRLTEILTHIRIKKVDVRGYFKKVSNTMLDFPILNLAISAQPHDIRLAIGSRPGIAMKAAKASEFLSEQPKINESMMEEATNLALAELNFATTNAASAEYRQVLARTYLQRGLQEVLTNVR